MAEAEAAAAGIPAAQAAAAEAAEAVRATPAPVSSTRRRGPTDSVAVAGVRTLRAAPGCLGIDLLPCQRHSLLNLAPQLE